MKFQIKHRYSLAVLFEAEAGTLNEVVQKAVAQRIDLRGSDLSGSDLSGSDLTYSDLRGSNLRGSDLTSSDLRGSKLSGSDLYDVKIRDGITVSRAPIQINGLRWPVTIWDAHMQIGCKFYSHADWAAFDNATIAAMDPDAAEFWQIFKSPLLALCKNHSDICRREE